MAPWQQRIVSEEKPPHSDARRRGKRKGTLASSRSSRRRPVALLLIDVSPDAFTQLVFMPRPALLLAAAAAEPALFACGPVPPV